MGVATFHAPPTSAAVCAFLGRAIHAAGTTPKSIVSDKGSQFWCDRFKRWCRKRGIRPRYGAIGRHGSIAVVERLIRTLKEVLREIVVPLGQRGIRRELITFVGWYNAHRPHTTLRGRTPDEVYFRRFPANRKPRIEPRPQWPRGSPCASPKALVAGRIGAGFEIDVERFAGHAHLPVVRLRRVA
jgi:transposase InsO family protein